MADHENTAIIPRPAEDVQGEGHTSPSASQLAAVEAAYILEAVGK